MAKRKTPAYKRKRNNKKRGAYRGKRKVARNFANSSMISYYSLNNLKQPLPPRFRTRLVAEAYGSQGTGPTSGTMRFYFNMNDPRIPFSGTVVSTPSFVYNNITSTTYQTPGFLSLCNVNTYRAFRVYSSSVQIDVNPGALADSITATITPSNFNAGPATVGAALSQPYTKSATFTTGRTSGDTKKNNTLSMYLPVHKFVGVRRQAIEDDLTGAFNGSYAPQIALGLPLYYVVNVNTSDNLPLVAVLDVRIRLTYYIEFFNQINETLQ